MDPGCRRLERRIHIDDRRLGVDVDNDIVQQVFGLRRTIGYDHRNCLTQVANTIAGKHRLAGDWMKSMWNDLVFDKSGNLYVPDDKPRIWRVSPDGTASIWFTDPRLTGFFGFAGGPLGDRIDPTEIGRASCRERVYSSV